MIIWIWSDFANFASLWLTKCAKSQQKKLYGIVDAIWTIHFQAHEIIK